MLSWPYLHVLLNHFPIILTTIGTLAIFVAMLHERRGTWVYALTTLTLAGVTVYPAWLTGGRAAHVVRTAWYIAPGAIQKHSSMADITLWIVAATGLMSFIALITVARTREAFSPAKFLRVLVSFLAIVSLASVIYTGYLGGEIVVQSPVLASPTPPLAVPAATTPAQVPASTSPASTLPAPTQAAPSTGSSAPSSAPSPATAVPSPATGAQPTAHP